MKPLALLSVSDKTGIVDFAKALIGHGFEILSTGNTARHLQENQLDVMGISYYTGMPEILDGRVKTLHPKVHGGLLAKPDDLKHKQEMGELNIRPIQLLAVNLYPFEQTVLSGAQRNEIIEKIDIGGPAMIRAAAKNAENVIVVVDPNDYAIALRLVEKDDPAIRRRLMAKAFAHTAFYDSLIAEYLSEDLLTETLTIGLRKSRDLRYGENPHQKAALYTRPFETKGACAGKQLWGKEMSFNNYLDANAAWELACELQRLFGQSRHVCVIVKHGNPCGAAWTTDPIEAFETAKAADPVSAFGGIVAIPGPLGAPLAQSIAAKGNFFEIIACQSASPEVLRLFEARAGWGQDVRIIECPLLPEQPYLDLRTVRGAALAQTSDAADSETWTEPTSRKLEPGEILPLKAAWICAKHVKSNAIVVCDKNGLIGVGAGQMNRVKSVRLALEQAGERARGAVLASDAFFPFADSIEEAAKWGIAAVVQPGGSKKDEEVIQAAERLGIKIALTGTRHFRH